MKLVRAFAFSGVQTVLKLALSFALVKIIAVSTGPAGLGLFNQFQTFISVLAIFATAPVSIGLVKYTAECKENDAAKAALFSTAVWCGLATSAVCGLLLEVFATPISQLVFRSEQYSFIIQLAGASNAFAVLNALLTSILNGERDFKRLMLANVWSNLLAVGFSVLLMHANGIYGAMLGYALGQCFACAVTVLITRYAPGIRARHFIQRIDWPVMRRLSSYTVTSLFTSAAVPIVEFMLRNRIAEKYSWVDAGYWQGLAKISDAYLLVINTFLGMYFLPSIAAATTRAALRNVVVESAQLILPVAAVFALGIYLCRSEVLLLLFSPAFLAAREHFGAQLFGDVLRVISGMIGYLIIVRATRTTYMLTEVAFLAAYLVGGYTLIDRFGWAGAVYAFVLCHIVYLMIGPIVAWRILR